MQGRGWGRKSKGNREGVEALPLSRVFTRNSFGHVDRLHKTYTHR